MQVPGLTLRFQQLEYVRIFDDCRRTIDPQRDVDGWNQEEDCRPRIVDDVAERISPFVPWSLRDQQGLLIQHMNESWSVSFGGNIASTSRIGRADQREGGSLNVLAAMLVKRGNLFLHRPLIRMAEHIAQSSFGIDDIRKWVPHGTSLLASQVKTSLPTGYPVPVSAA